jgi:ribonuclease R
MDEFAERVLKLVSEAAYTPLSLKAIARRFEVDGQEYSQLRAAVKRLITEEKLVLTKDKTLRAPDRAGMIVGLFRRSAKGFGFVRPHGTAVRAEQIFIPADAARDASSGDEVAVKLTKRTRRRGLNAEGRVVSVLSRASSVFVGTYFERAGAGFVQVDGTAFAEPVFVGDPSPKGARPGDKVALEMVRYPTAYQGGEGVVTEILGKRGAPGVDSLAVVRAFNIPDRFEQSVLDEAREEAEKFHDSEIGARLDLRAQPTVTIDPATAHDFDDAISLARDAQGRWNLGVHIADVSHFVRARSALDRTARHRGTSVYLADRVIPMLPEILSNSLASLQEGRTRFTVSALLEFDPTGFLISKRFARSAICVARRFTYEEALAVMKQPRAAHMGVGPELALMLGEMLELAQILRRRRFARGGLELTLPEIEIELGDRGEVKGAHLAPHTESHQVIEDFMLAANEAVASDLSEHDVSFLRRVHPDPEPYKLAEFAEFARSLGLALEQPQSRFELQRILETTVGTPEEYAVHYGLLRSLKQACYSPEPEGHYALASPNYCHFTSPIRRYPDLQVHRQLIAILDGKRPRVRADELTVLGEHCNITERRAEAAERDLIRVKLLSFLESQVGREFHAIIVGVEDFGIFCRLTELPVEGLVHVSSLVSDDYYLEPGTHTLVGRRSGRRHRLGDRRQVRIAHVDVDRRALELALLDDGPHGRRSRARGAAAPAEDLSASGPPRAQKAAPTLSHSVRSKIPTSAGAKSGPSRQKKKVGRGKKVGKKGRRARN